jgi:S1-C subfamily serine protease
MTHSLFHRTVFGIITAAFLATGAASFYVAFAQHHPAATLNVGDRLPGLTLERSPLPEAGLVVTSLQSAGPAELAGLAVGDDVLAVDQKPVTSLSEVRDLLKHQTATTVHLLVLHKGRPIDVSLALSEDHMHGA